MKKRTDIKTRTYEAGFEDFMIDIVETADMYEAYIYREKSGYRSHIIGLMKADTTLREFKEMLENEMTENMYYYDQDMDDLDEMHTQKSMEGRTS